MASTSERNQSESDMDCDEIICDLSDTSDTEIYSYHDTDSEQNSEADEELPNDDSEFYFGKDGVTKWKKTMWQKTQIRTRNCTNAYISKIKEHFSRERDAKLTTATEILALFGLLIMSGVKRAAHLTYKELWAVDGSGVEIVKAIMSQERFLFILRCLRFDDITTRKERKKLDKPAPIREFVEAFVYNCKKLYTPGEYNTIDEKLIPFRGRTHNKLICFPPLPANSHKHETQPELLKALGLQIIEENSSLFDIIIYTDGSQLETGLSGSGIAIYKDKILYGSKRHQHQLAKQNNNLLRLKSSHLSLQSCFSSQEPLLKSIAKSVNRLPANSSVTVQWLPAHVGIPGNELADSLAKAEALGLPEARESTTQLDESDLLRTIKTQCLQEWKSNAAHDWYRAGGTSTGSVLPREQQSLISRLKSGHLRTMTFQNGCKVFPLCTKCNSQPATQKRIIDCTDSSIDELYSSPSYRHHQKSQALQA
ncbi:hypothetical protein LAZ67_4001087 [Cordylochernes scorpioides]|uniref:RNase H type-1 domain-containing protein n=1 Tax=Cordylochernes scorpioides TaxID=51811 RepID=A0ABY6KGF2_9ARAC|nr:hypothetical protein LAZ67_4001087 [Cordylochernes scorpioides]